MKVKKTSIKCCTTCTVTSQSNRISLVDWRLCNTSLILWCRSNACQTMESACCSWPPRPSMDNLTFWLNFSMFSRSQFFTFSLVDFSSWVSSLYHHFEFQMAPYGKTFSSPRLIMTHFACLHNLNAVPRDTNKINNLTQLNENWNTKKFWWRKCFWQKTARRDSDFRF